MFKKEINLIYRCELYLPQKIASRECILRGPKMLKIDTVRDGGWSHVSGYMAQDFWTAGLLAHG